MPVRVRIALAAAIFVTAAATAGAQAAVDIQRATDSLRRLVDRGVVPSVSYSVSSRSRVIYEGAFGYADVAKHLRATARTSYPVASVAKSYTAIGALRAWEKGKLDLDRPVNSYLGDDSIRVPVGHADRLTTRTLLHMTGGIPHVVRFHWPDEPADKSWDHDLGHFAAFPPGEQFYYSNASLGLVGDILARVSGKSFSVYMADEVFRPLGLSSTRVRLGELPAGLRARAYRDNPARPSGFTRLDPEGGAGMYTSAHDLTTLARAVILQPNDRFLTSRSRSQLTDFSSYPYYSSGWWKDPFRANGLTLVADGAALGHSASMKVLPNEGVAVAVIVNGSVNNGFTMGLCDLLLRAAGFGAAVPTNAEVPAAFQDRPVKGDTAWSGAWKGEVTTATGTIPVRVEFDSAGMKARVGVGPLEASDATVANRVLEGGVAGELPSGVVGGVAHKLSIRLRHSDDILTGYVSASAMLGDRPFVVLPFYVSLKRTDAEPASREP